MHIKKPENDHQLPRMAWISLNEPACWASCKYVSIYSDMREFHFMSNLPFDRLT